MFSECAFRLLARAWDVVDHPDAQDILSRYEVNELEPTRTAKRKISKRIEQNKSSTPRGCRS